MDNLGKGNPMRPLLLIMALAACLSAAACDGSTHIKAVEPNFGNISGNDDVVIVGNGFQPGMTVRFGKLQAKSVVIDSPKRIRVKTPAGVEGVVDVIITRDDGKTFGLENAFTYRSGS